MNDRGAYSIKIVLANKTGRPDIIACYRGKFLAIEVKDKDGKLTPLQTYNLDKINKSGGFAIMVKDIESVNNLLNIIDRI